MKPLNKYIDHTLLKPQSTRSQIRELCDQAREFDFASVCVNPCWIRYCRQQLAGSQVKVCTVIGFPLGAMTTEAKVAECRDAVEKGADEIDMVINIGALIDGEMEFVSEEIRRVKEAAGDRILKVILETCLLSDEQKVQGCRACVAGGADFVKTSTGFSTGGATVEDVRLMKQTVGEACQVKAAGGVRSYEDLIAMIEAGADRIGTSSGTRLLQNASSSRR